MDKTIYLDKTTHKFIGKQKHLVFIFRHAYSSDFEKLSSVYLFPQKMQITNHCSAF